MGKGFETEDGANSSNNPTLHSLDASRRHWLAASASAVVALLGSHALPLAAAPSHRRPLGFTAVPVSSADSLVVAPEYQAEVLLRWGDPIGAAAGAPAFKADASNSAAEQALQAGMHHDGMHFFPLGSGSTGSRRGLLVLNHEYTDDGLLHTDGQATWTAEKVRKSQAAHGVSVVEIVRGDAGWQIAAASRLARRITAYTPMRLAGPAAGHALLQTAADPSGSVALGTFNNCANGFTPWGTYLTCEENWNGYFATGAQPSADEKRYGLRPDGWGYRWHEHDERFDAARHPNEPHRFGWVVEIDPFDPDSTPVKHTALGRIKHEGAAFTVSRDGRAVVYMGDDERFEYIYKFVSRDKVRPGQDARARAANRELLDHGTLYVARFDSNGFGQWLPLVQGEGPLTAAQGFASQAEVLVRCRQAADAVGATKMDRPEWIAVHPVSGEVFVTLTNNSERGQPGKPPVDDANPRANNIFGHVLRWKEEGGAASDRFRWAHFVLGGDPDLKDPARQGQYPSAKADKFGSPDGLWIDPAGLMWIQTDISTSALGKGDYAGIGNNMMLCADPASGEIKRFLTGPRGCEITGITMTPDRRSLFVNIQHPGESPSERGDPAKPQAVSSWPDGPQGGRPRSATVVIRRKDGGVVGT